MKKQVDGCVQRWVAPTDSSVQGDLCIPSLSRETPFIL